MVANGFEGVAWMIGGGAKHSANIGRVLAYAATAGGEGVVAPGDCKVSPTGQADNQVHVATGAVVIRNRYGAAQSESYITRAPQVSDLTVGSTGSSARSDLVVVRIKDPQYGAQAPASLADGPYVFPEIIPGVAAGTTSAKTISALLNQPVYAVARIDIPANTTVITGGMIKDLRELVLPRSRREMYSNNAGAFASTLTATDWVTWPGVTAQVKVPEWATHADMRIDISGIVQLAALADAELIAQIGSGAVSGPLPLDMDGFSDGQRHGATLTVGPTDVTGMRGQTITLRALARRIAVADHPGTFRVDGSTHVGYDIQFNERPL